MPDEIVFLFGAGASRGAGHVDPYCPPVMDGLYDELAKLFPEWGPGTLYAAHAKKFRENFEQTFSEEVLTFGGGIPKADTLTLLEKQRPLALYFSRFVLNCGLDYYSKLLSRLMDSGKISHCLFGSINYDCLFEQAAHKLGLRADYLCVDSESVRVAKLHGSCNFVTERITQHGRAMLASPGLHYELKFDFLPPFNVEAALKEKLVGVQPAHFAVMSQVSPGKEDFLAQGKILEIRQKWVMAVSAASTVVIIGVSYNPNDTHIVETIRKTPAKILYIGGEEDFKAWKVANYNIEHLGRTFDEGFDFCRRPRSH